MSHHWESILAAADLKFSSLHRKFKEGREVSGGRIRDVRELTLSIMGKEMVLRRVYMNGVDSGGLRDVGWIVNEGVYYCLVCSVPFDAVTWRHHCRACGLVTCNSCTSRLVRIEGFEHYGKQRVCKHCNPRKERRVALLPDADWGSSIADKLLESSPGKPVDALHDPTLFQVSKKSELPVFGMSCVPPALSPDFYYDGCLVFAACRPMETWPCPSTTSASQVCASGQSEGPTSVRQRLHLRVRTAIGEPGHPHTTGGGAGHHRRGRHGVRRRS